MHEELERMIMQNRYQALERLKCFEKLSVRMDQKDDIEMFALIQAIGLTEGILRQVLNTCHSKQSVFSVRLVQVLQEAHVDPRILNLLLKGSSMQTERGPLSPEVIQTSNEIREEALVLLKDVVSRRRTCR